MFQAVSNYIYPAGKNNVDPDREQNEDGGARSFLEVGRRMKSAPAGHRPDFCLSVARLFCFLCGCGVLFASLLVRLTFGENQFWTAV